MTERSIIFNGAMVRAIQDGRKTQMRRVVKPPPTELWDPRERRSVWRWQPKDYDINLEHLNQCLLGKLCPYGQPGDRLWVRETHRQLSGPDWGEHQRGAPLEYKADGVYPSAIPWRSPIHMPRWASRITLEVTEVRVERVQGISEEDAVAEGLSEFLLGNPKRPITSPTVAAAAALGFCTLLPASRRRFLATCASATFAGVAGWLAGGNTPQAFPKKLSNRQVFALIWDSINARRGYGWEANPWVFVIGFRNTQAEGK